MPYVHVRKQVDVRLTERMVEVLFDNRRIAVHPRSTRKGEFTTDPSHRPKAHQRHLEWTPSRIVAWAGKTGPRTGELIRRVLESKPHPEQGYRACLGILRLGDRYGPGRLEAACDRALRIHALTYRSVRSILQSGLDQVPLTEQVALSLPQNHEHVRGRAYYARAATTPGDPQEC